MLLPAYEVKLKQGMPGTAVPGYPARFSVNRKRFVIMTVILSGKPSNF